mmetsp:Transcript_4092/g.7462  ORF Transcript_4092/g.7462 Transcript_4092/m.7462 type:complete len:191 (-) Transcript_4092:102-674(-)
MSAGEDEDELPYCGECEQLMAVDEHPKERWTCNLCGEAKTRQALQFHCAACNRFACEECAFVQDDPSLQDGDDEWAGYDDTDAEYWNMDAEYWDMGPGAGWSGWPGPEAEEEEAEDWGDEGADDADADYWDVGALYCELDDEAVCYAIKHSGGEAHSHEEEHVAPQLTDAEKVRAAQELKNLLNMKGGGA